MKFNVKIVFLHEDVPEEIYMVQPDDYSNKLGKSLQVTEESIWTRIHKSPDRKLSICIPDSCIFQRNTSSKIKVALEITLEKLTSI